MSPSDTDGETILLVEGPLGVPIQVMDGKLRTVATGAGRLTASLREGIYTVRWFGTEPEERTVRLFASAKPAIVKGGGSGQAFDPIALSDDVPMGSAGSQQQAGGRKRTPKPAPVPSLVVVVEQDDHVIAKSDPARSVRVLDAQRDEVARWSERSGQRRGRLQATLPPGAYVVRYKSTGNRVVEQTVVVTSGRQTVVRLSSERGYEFRGREGHRTPTAVRGIDPARTVILSVTEGSSGLYERDISRARTLLRGLNARSALLDEQLTQMSARDADPYMRLYCGLLVAKACHDYPDRAQWAQGIAQQIAGALPSEFEADVSALRWRLDPSAGLPAYGQLRMPPMLAISWRWISEWTVQAPGIVARGEMMDAASDAPSAFLPWLVWNASALRRAAPRAVRETQVDPELHLRELLDQIFAETSLERFTGIGSSGLTVGLKGLANRGQVLSADVGRFVSDLGHVWTRRDQPMSELAGDLGLPAGSLVERAEDTLEELRSTRDATA